MLIPKLVEAKIVRAGEALRSPSDQMSASHRRPRCQCGVASGALAHACVRCKPPNLSMTS